MNIGDNLLKKISDEYETDSFFKDIFRKPTEPYKRMGYRLYLNDKLCIPSGNIEKTILNDNHESLLGAHRGYKKTLSLILGYFYWPNMKKELRVTLRPIYSLIYCDFFRIERNCTSTAEKFIYLKI